MASIEVIKPGSRLDAHDATVLTSFNPFEDDERSQTTSYALVSSLLSKVRQSLSTGSGPSAPAHTPAPAPNAANSVPTSMSSSVVAPPAAAPNTQGSGSTQRTLQSASSSSTVGSLASQTPNTASRSKGKSVARDKPRALLQTGALKPAGIAPPLVSRTPALSEPTTSFASPDIDTVSMRSSPFFSGNPVDNSADPYNSIPGFPSIQDSDARSVHTVASTSFNALNGISNRSQSVSKIIRRIRGEGLSRDYWMDDEKVRECFDCSGVFTTWRRKHHCRICGQIFCGRCASNIIKGSRFGADSMIRVCNGCMQRIKDAERDDDDDDRRSIVSSYSFSTSSPFTAHQMGFQNHHADFQSHYSSNALFSSSTDPLPLFSSSSRRRSLSSSDDGDVPAEQVSDWDGRSGTAPFRRAIADDDRAEVMTTSSKNVDAEPGAEVSLSLNGEVVDQDVQEPLQSSIQFPGSSGNAESKSPSPRPSRVNSMEPDLLREVLRSRNQSYVNPAFGEPGLRMRRESTFKEQEQEKLNSQAVFHFRLLLGQMLVSQQIPEARQWQETLTRLVEKVAGEITFLGQDMDLRRFVKIKKLPGGAPRDSEFVSGAVITKNFAHRQMPRSQENPRVVLWSIDDRRDNEFVLLDHARQTVPQRWEKTAERILRLQPTVVLASTPMEGVIMERLFAEKQICVARNVDPNAMQFVARSTNATIISGYDKLAVVGTHGPRAGSCQRVVVQTYDHPLIPGRRKTLMRFENVPKELGRDPMQEVCCTIILRGGTVETLRRVKAVTRFLVFLLRNLSTESCLWGNMLLTSPTVAYGDAAMLVAAPVPLAPPRLRAISSPSLSLVALGSRTPTVASPTLLRSAWVGPIMENILDARPSAPPVTSPLDDDELNDEDLARLRLSRDILKSYEDYTRTFISVSSTLRFAPPFPITRMKEIDEKLHRARHAWEDEVIRREEKAHQLPDDSSSITSPGSNAESPGFYGHSQEDTITIASYDSAVSSASTLSMISTGSASSVSTLLAASSDILASPTPRAPAGPEDSPSYFEHKLVSMPSQSSFQSTKPSLSSTIVTSSDVRIECHPLRPVSDIALESAVSAAEVEHDQARRVWEWYIRKNKDDFVLEKYQSLAVRQSIVPASDNPQQQRPCFPPRLTYFNYYGKNDVTLGQYFLTHAIEFLKYAAAGRICEGKDCNISFENHCTLYHHNETRLAVMTEKFEPLKAHHSHLIDPKDNLPMMDALVSAKDQPPWKITTCSYCRICKFVTPFEEVRDLATYYSFAKFLELFFYPVDPVVIQDSTCEHNVWQTHTRYFMISRVLFSFTATPVTVHEIVFPPVRMRVEPESLLETKNSDYKHIVTRVATFYRHLTDDLRCTARDDRTGQEKIDAQLGQIISSLVAQAERERNEIMTQIHSFYLNTAAVDTLAFTWPRAMLQERIVDWQSQLSHLPKPRPLTDKRASGLSATVKLAWSRRNEPSLFDRSHFMSSSLSEVDEFSARRKLTNGSITSASETDSIREKEDNTSDAESALEAEKPVALTAAVIDPAVPLVLEIPVVGAPEARSVVDLGISPSSGGDSDSTVGAKRRVPEPTITEVHSPPSQIRHPRADRDYSSSSRSRSHSRARSRSRLGSSSFGDSSSARASRLPKRTGPGLSVAELVRQYQNIHPGGYKEFPRSSVFGPSMTSAYDTDLEGQEPPRLLHRKSKGRATHKRSTSTDFESGYAANIGTRYLANERRSTTSSSAVAPPAPRRVRPSAFSSSESRGPSRRASPDKRVALGRTNIPAPIPRSDLTASVPAFARPISPTNLRSSIVQAPTKSSKGKQKSTVPRPSSTLGRNALRKPAQTAPSNKVSNLTRQFERIHKETERSNRRYAVIRGKKARPVATARAKVEVFDNIEDAIADMSDDTDSSEADDEDEGVAPEVGTDPAGPATTAADPAVPELNNPSPPPVVAPLSDSPSETPNRPTTPVQTTPSQPDGLEQSPASQSLPKETPSLALDLTTLPPTVPQFFSDGRSVNEAQSDAESIFGTDRHMFMRALSGLWSQPLGTPSSARRTRMELELEDQIIDPVHIFKGSNIVVRTDEPTSIIAFTLDSNQYKVELAKAQSASRSEQRAPHSQEPSEPFMPDDSSNTGDTSTYSVIGASEVQAADQLKEHTKVTPSYTFESENITITCTPFFVEQFDALRKMCGCDKSIIESLARCVKWDATGGKSGSAFLKTKDDRFIAKELSKAEVEAMATFVPAYFDYMSTAIASGRPTLLAKIFGFFRISIRMLDSPKGGRPVMKTKRLQLFVMENLFYSRKFTTIYDLKGSSRNRLVQTTGRENEVLLDENLMQTAHLNPLFVREHSKRILRSAIYNDTKFLAEMNVMDYSLVVGVDPLKRELVVGIVDYVRTYTWDKKLENLIKDPLLIGGLGGKNEPTVVTPKTYKARFRLAMERYFGLVPDRWMKEQDAPETDGVAPL